MYSVFCSPARYTQGEHATRELGREMAYLGLRGPVLLLAGGSARRLLSATWEASLGAADLPYQVEPFGGECTPAEVERVGAAARSLGARAIVGAGGGKVLDAARAVAADLELPVVNCPTVASSDAPCSALSVLYTEAGTVHSYRIYRRNPDLVLVDTHVIAQGPPRLLAAGMGDALATWFEAKACEASGARNMRGGASTRSALALARLCYDTLLADGTAALEAVRNRTTGPALERLVEANTLLSGLGFESSGLAAAHAVHNGLTEAPGIHAFYHGEKVAFGVLVQLALEQQPEAVWGEVLDFSVRVGLPLTLAELDLDEPAPDLLHRIAVRATAPGETIHNEPFPVTPAAVVEAIRAADARGRERRRRFPAADR